MSARDFAEDDGDEVEFEDGDDDEIGSRPEACIHCGAPSPPPRPGYEASVCSACE